MPIDHFALATRVFALFPRTDQARALELCARLPGASVRDRFVAAVCAVIEETANNAVIDKADVS